MPACQAVPCERFVRVQAYLHLSFIVNNVFSSVSCAGAAAAFRDTYPAFAVEDGKPCSSFPQHICVQQTAGVSCRQMSLVSHAPLYPLPVFE